LWFRGSETGHERHDFGIEEAIETPVVEIESGKKGSFHGGGMAEIITEEQQDG
jgi:hypothetical protein